MSVVHNVVSELGQVVTGSSHQLRSRATKSDDSMSVGADVGEVGPLYEKVP